VLWSLPFEFQMYLVLPALFVVARAQTRHAWRWILFLWLAVVALVLLLWKLGASFELIRFFPCFLPGVLAYCLRESRPACSPGVLFGYVGAMVAAFPLLVGLGISATLVAWVVCLVLGALIPMCRELRSPWLRRSGETIARYSYGIYLVHVPILRLSFQHADRLSPLLSWPLFAGGVAGATYLAYHYIEKPGVAYGRLLAQRIDAGRARSAPNA
jgi:peptidoglycan/LPS O-acetylase OafA/YrhL